MNLVIDIGNTWIKTAVFKENILLFKDQFQSDQIVSRVLSTIEQYNIKHAIISHVAHLDEDIFLELKKMVNTIELNYSTKIQFKNL